MVWTTLEDHINTKYPRSNSLRAGEVWHKVGVVGVQGGNHTRQRSDRRGARTLNWKYPPSLLEVAGQSQLSDLCQCYLLVV